tara:strand:- start:244 stop:444 length:201 start_codon:yes stop_codon:yes gene_type:complete
MGLVVVDERSKRMQSGPKKKTKLKKKLNVFRKLEDWPGKETNKLPKEQDGKTQQQQKINVFRKLKN